MSKTSIEESDASSCGSICREEMQNCLSEFSGWASYIVSSQENPWLEHKLLFPCSLVMSHDAKTAWDATKTRALPARFWDLWHRDNQRARETAIRSQKKFRFPISTRSSSWYGQRLYWGRWGRLPCVACLCNLFTFIGVEGIAVAYLNLCCPLLTVVTFHRVLDCGITA